MSAAQAAEIVLFLEIRHGEQPTVYGGDGMEHRDSVLLDALQNIFRRGAAAEDRAGDAVTQREKQIMTEGADKAPFTSSHNHIVFSRRQPVAVQIAQGDDPAVCMDDAFGFAGGARSVND